MHSFLYQKMSSLQLQIGTLKKLYQLLRLSNAKYRTHDEFLDNQTVDPHLSPLKLKFFFKINLNAKVSK